MDVLSTAHDFGNVFSCCEARTKNKRCKQVILVITFILLTFDLVTGSTGSSGQKLGDILGTNLFLSTGQDFFVLLWWEQS